MLNAAKVQYSVLITFILLLSLASNFASTNICIACFSKPYSLSCPTLNLAFCRCTILSSIQSQTCPPLTTLGKVLAMSLQGFSSFSPMHQHQSSSGPLFLLYPHSCPCISTRFVLSTSCPHSRYSIRTCFVLSKPF